jgi:acyl-CoA thioester hydrolase
VAPAGSARDGGVTAVFRFIHVYVDRATRRPTPLPPQLLCVLETLT